MFQQEGISTRRLQRTFGCGLKTAWFLSHRIEPHEFTDFCRAHTHGSYSQRMTDLASGNTAGKRSSIDQSEVAQQAVARKADAI